MDNIKNTHNQLKNNTINPKNSVYNQKYNNALYIDLITFINTYVVYYKAPVTYSFSRKSKGMIALLEK